MLLQPRFVGGPDADGTDTDHQFDATVATSESAARRDRHVTSLDRLHTGGIALQIAADRADPHRGVHVGGHTIPKVATLFGIQTFDLLRAEDLGEDTDFVKSLLSQ